MKRKTFFVALLLCVVLILSSCSLIDSIFDPLPEKYVDGLREPKDLPDELELYDDAIVYDVDEDDESVELSYGVSEDLDEIMDFYEDLFDENEIEIIELDDDDDEFYVSGKGEGFTFELEAEPATAGYKKRAFETIITIEVLFVESDKDAQTAEPEDATPIPDAETAAPTDSPTSEPGSETLSKMSGFWMLVGLDGDMDDSYKAEGVALYFTGDSMVGYSGFEIDIYDVIFAFSDDNTITYTTENEMKTVNIDFQVIDGIEIMTWAFDGKIGYFAKSRYDDFMAYNDSVTANNPDDNTISLDQEFTDEELAEFIDGVEWNELYYIYSDGSTEDIKPNSIIFYLDSMTGVDTYDEPNDFVWRIVDGILYFDYVSDEIDDISLPIDIKYDGTYGYLYLYVIEENVGSAWIYWAE